MTENIPPNPSMINPPEKPEPIEYRSIPNDAIVFHIAIQGKFDPAEIEIRGPSQSELNGGPIRSQSVVHELNHLLTTNIGRVERPPEGTPSPSELLVFYDFASLMLKPSFREKLDLLPMQMLNQTLIDASCPMPAANMFKVGEKPTKAQIRENQKPKKNIVISRERKSAMHKISTKDSSSEHYLLFYDAHPGSCLTPDQKALILQEYVSDHSNTRADRRNRREKAMQYRDLNRELLSKQRMRNSLREDPNESNIPSPEDVDHLTTYFNNHQIRTVSDFAYMFQVSQSIIYRVLAGFDDPSFIGDPYTTDPKSLRAKRAQREQWRADRDAKKEARQGIHTQYVKEEDLQRHFAEGFKHSRHFQEILDILPPNTANPDDEGKKIIISILQEYRQQPIFCPQEHLTLVSTIASGKNLDPELVNYIITQSGVCHPASQNLVMQIEAKIRDLILNGVNFERIASQFYPGDAAKALIYDFKNNKAATQEVPEDSTVKEIVMKEGDIVFLPGDSKRTHRIIAKTALELEMDKQEEEAKKDYNAALSALYNEIQNMKPKDTGLENYPLVKMDLMRNYLYQLDQFRNTYFPNNLYPRDQPPQPWNLWASVAHNIENYFIKNAGHPIEDEGIKQAIEYYLKGTRPSILDVKIEPKSYMDKEYVNQLKNLLDLYVVAQWAHALLINKPSKTTWIEQCAEFIALIHGMQKSVLLGIVEGRAEARELRQRKSEIRRGVNSVDIIDPTIPLFNVLAAKNKKIDAKSKDQLPDAADDLKKEGEKLIEYIRTLQTSLRLAGTNVICSYSGKTPVFHTSKVPIMWSFIHRTTKMSGGTFFPNKDRSLPEPDANYFYHKYCKDLLNKLNKSKDITPENLPFISNLKGLTSPTAVIDKAVAVVDKTTKAIKKGATSPKDVAKTIASSIDEGTPVSDELFKKINKFIFTSDQSRDEAFLFLFEDIEKYLNLQDCRKISLNMAHTLNPLIDFIFSSIAFTFNENRKGIIQIYHSSIKPIEKMLQKIRKMIDEFFSEENIKNFIGISPKKVKINDEERHSYHTTIERLAELKTLTLNSLEYRVQKNLSYRPFSNICETAKTKHAVYVFTNNNILKPNKTHSMVSLKEKLEALPLIFSESYEVKDDPESPTATILKTIDKATKTISKIAKTVVKVSKTVAKAKNLIKPPNTLEPFENLPEFIKDFLPDKTLAGYIDLALNLTPKESFFNQVRDFKTQLKITEEDIKEDEKKELTNSEEETEIDEENEDEDAVKYADLDQFREFGSTTPQVFQTYSRKDFIKEIKDRFNQLSFPTILSVNKTLWIEIKSKYLSIFQDTTNEILDDLVKFDVLLDYQFFSTGCSFIDSIWSELDSFNHKKEEIATNLIESEELLDKIRRQFDDAKFKEFREIFKQISPNPTFFKKKLEEGTLITQPVFLDNRSIIIAARNWVSTLISQLSQLQSKVRVLYTYSLSEKSINSEKIKEVLQQLPHIIVCLKDYEAKPFMAFSGFKNIFAKISGTPQLFFNKGIFPENKSIEPSAYLTKKEGLLDLINQNNEKLFTQLCQIKKKDLSKLSIDQYQLDKTIPQIYEFLFIIQGRILGLINKDYEQLGKSSLKFNLKKVKFQFIDGKIDAKLFPVIPKKYMGFKLEDIFGDPWNFISDKGDHKENLKVIATNTVTSLWRNYYKLYHFYTLLPSPQPKMVKKTTQAIKGAVESAMPGLSGLISLDSAKKIPFSKMTLFKMTDHILKLKNKKAKSPVENAKSKIKKSKIRNTIPDGANLNAIFADKNLLNEISKNPIVIKGDPKGKIGNNSFVRYCKATDLEIILQSQKYPKDFPTQTKDQNKNAILELKATRYLLKIMEIDTSQLGTPIQLRTITEKVKSEAKSLAKIPFADKFNFTQLFKKKDVEYSQEELDKNITAIKTELKTIDFSQDLDEKKISAQVKIYKTLLTRILKRKPMSKITILENNMRKISLFDKDPIQYQEYLIKDQMSRSRTEDKKKPKKEDADAGEDDSDEKEKTESATSDIFYIIKHIDDSDSALELPIFYFVFIIRPIDNDKNLLFVTKITSQQGQKSYFYDELTQFFSGFPDKAYIKYDQAEGTYPPIMKLIEFVSKAETMKKMAALYGIEIPLLFNPFAKYIEETFSLFSKDMQKFAKEFNLFFGNTAFKELNDRIFSVAADEKYNQGKLNEYIARIQDKIAKISDKKSAQEKKEHFILFLNEFIEDAERNSEIDDLIPLIKNQIYEYTNLYEKKEVDKNPDANEKYQTICTNFIKKADPSKLKEFWKEYQDKLEISILIELLNKNPDIKIKGKNYKFDFDKNIKHSLLNLISLFTEKIITSLIKDFKIPPKKLSVEKISNIAGKIKNWIKATFSPYMDGFSGFSLLPFYDPKKTDQKTKSFLDLAVDILEEKYGKDYKLNDQKEFSGSYLGKILYNIIKTYSYLDYSKVSKDNWKNSANITSGLLKFPLYQISNGINFDIAYSIRKLIPYSDFTSPSLIRVGFDVGLKTNQSGELKIAINGAENEFIPQIFSLQHENSPLGNTVELSTDTIDISNLIASPKSSKKIPPDFFKKMYSNEIKDIKDRDNEKSNAARVLARSNLISKALSTRAKSKNHISSYFTAKNAKFERNIVTSKSAVRNNAQINSIKNSNTQTQFEINRTASHIAAKDSIQFSTEGQKILFNKPNDKFVEELEGIFPMSNDKILKAKTSASIKSFLSDTDTPLDLKKPWIINQKKYLKGLLTRITLEDLRGYKPVAGEPFAIEKSQWTRGKLSDYILDKARQNGIQFQKVKPAYTSKLNIRSRSEGIKGFIVRYHPLLSEFQLLNGPFEPVDIKQYDKNTGIIICDKNPNEKWIKDNLPSMTRQKAIRIIQNNLDLNAFIKKSSQDLKGLLNKSKSLKISPQILSELISGIPLNFTSAMTSSGTSLKRLLQRLVSKDKNIKEIVKNFNTQLNKEFSSVPTFFIPSGAGNLLLAEYYPESPLKAKKWFIFDRDQTAGINLCQYNIIAQLFDIFGLLIDRQMESNGYESNNRKKLKNYINTMNTHVKKRIEFLNVSNSSYDFSGFKLETAIGEWFNQENIDLPDSTIIKTNDLQASFYYYSILFSISKPRTSPYKEISYPEWIALLNSHFEKYKNKKYNKIIPKNLDLLKKWDINSYISNSFQEILKEITKQNEIMEMPFKPIPVIISESMAPEIKLQDLIINYKKLILDTFLLGTLIKNYDTGSTAIESFESIISSIKNKTNMIFKN